MIGSVIARHSQELQGIGTLGYETKVGQYTIHYKRTAGGGKRDGALLLLLDKQGDITVRSALFSEARSAIPLGDMNHQVLDDIVQDFLVALLKE